MEGILVPAWALWVIGTLFLGWASWISILTINNRQDIAISKQQDVVVSDKLSELSEHIDSHKADVRGMFKDLNSRLDTFLSNEMEFLKTEVKWMKRDA